MIDPKIVILFTASPLTGVEVGNRVVGGAGGEVANAIVGGKLPMDGEGATPPRAWDEGSVVAIRVATVGKGVDFEKRSASTWLAKRLVRCPNSEGKSCRRSVGL